MPYKKLQAEEEEDDKMALPKNARLFVDPRYSKQELLDNISIDTAIDTDALFGPSISPNDPIQLSKNKNNSIYLASGDHKGFTSNKLGTVINGSAGSYFSAPVVCESGSTTLFINCTFIQTPANSNGLVELKEGSRTIFQHCTFIRLDKKDKVNAGEINPATCAFVQLNTSTVAETLFTAEGCVFIAEADSGANALFWDIGTAAGAGFMVLAINKTTPLVPVGAGIINFGVI